MSSRLRCVYMGTPDFAVAPLRALAASEEVTLVVTNPDRPAGRSKFPVPPPVKVEAEALGVSVFQPAKVRLPESVERIAQERPDAIIVVAYGHILPKSILDIPRLGCINVHGSILPKYRGAAPIQWAVVNGETETGVTIMKMDVGCDTGPTYLVRTIPITEEDTAGSIFEKLSPLGASALMEAVAGLKDGTLVATPQDDSLATHAPMLLKETGRIDWTKRAHEVRDLVRGMSPWPSAYAFHAGKPLKVMRSAVVPGDAGGVPGEIVDVTKEGLVVACGTGRLLLLELQPEGGKPMTGAAYANGRRVAKGELLSPPPTSAA